MRTSFNRFVSRILIVCLLGLPFQARAGLIGTDEVVGAAQAQAARDALNSFLNRSDVAAQLQALGLTPQAARERVDALTDAEAARLAGQIERLPAGGVILGMALVIAFLIWRFYFSDEAKAAPKEAAKPAAKPAPKEAPK